MRSNVHVFESSGLYRLVPLEVQEGADVPIPEGARLIHTEPLTEDESIAGFDLWFLVPSNKIEAAVVSLSEEDEDASEV